MRGLINDFLRRIIAVTIIFAGVLSSCALQIRMLRFGLNQKRLKRKYSVKCGTPVLSYGPELVQSIRAAALKTGQGAKFARTSSSTGKAKEILYTKQRLLALKFTFSEMFARACRTFRLKRTSLYVFSSFEADTSLTSLLLDENAFPNYLSTLQAPYRLERHPSIQALVSKYGSVAVRLWVLTISNPGVLYSTNPSTISTFLDKLANDWRNSASLIRDWCEDRFSFDPEVRRIAGRLESRGSSERLERVAFSDAPLPLWLCAPAVEAYICWTGGYVQPFLDRLARYLPSSRYRLIPMYSMSTETIETLPYFQHEDIAFLPLAAGVVYEFIEETATDEVNNLLSAKQLETGKLYAVVVSDNYGLRRYQTDDLFLCKRHVHGLPDLAFVRRRSLEYSFSGEKLTAVQLSAVFEQLRALYPSLVADRFLTCVPAQSALAVPHYKVMLVGERCSAPEASHDFLARRCDEMLGEVNSEYKSKRASGRLGPVKIIEIRLSDFTERFAQNGNWETQFKLLPLCRIL